MRRPAWIKPWLSPEDLQTWVREAQTRDELQKRLAIWLTHSGPFTAHHVAALVGISTPTVWQWVGQYNRLGPNGLARVGRGGRRWAYLTPHQEAAFFEKLRQRAQQGDILNTRRIQIELCSATGKKVSRAYVYRLLGRHHWHKSARSLDQVKSSSTRQGEFKTIPRPSFGSASVAA
jgi:transposase